MATVDQVAIVQVGTMVPAGGGISAGQYTSITGRLDTLETAGNVSTADLAANAVTTAKIADGQITYAKIAGAALGPAAGKVAIGDHAHIDVLTRGFQAGTGSQSASDTSSTSNIAVGSDVGAMLVSVTLPGVSADKWTIVAMGFLQMKRSVAGNSFVMVTINANEGTGRDLGISAAEWVTCYDNHILAGINGGQTISVRVRFRGSDSGVTNARQPGIIWQAYRTL